MHLADGGLNLWAQLKDKAASQGLYAKDGRKVNINSWFT